MESVLNWFKWAVALTGGIITTALGGWDIMLQVLVYAVIVDYVVGLIAAYVEKGLNSEIGFKGIAKKVLLFVPVALAFALDQVLGQYILRNLAIWFYLANEGLSILENVGRAGVPIPPPLKLALEQLYRKSEGEKVEVTGGH